MRWWTGKQYEIKVISHINPVKYLRRGQEWTSLCFSPDRTSADCRNTLILHIPKDIKPERSQNLLFSLLTVDINSNPEAADILQSHTVYEAVMHIVPISKTLPWNTGFIAYTPVQEISSANPSKWSANLGAETEQKHHISRGWKSGENHYESCSSGAHCCAPTCLFSDLSAMSTG